MSAEGWHTASDGSRWYIVCDCPPVPYRHWDWCATHEDYDGAPDAYDKRVAYGATREKCIEDIEEVVREVAEMEEA